MPGRIAIATAVLLLLTSPAVTAQERQRPRQPREAEEDVELPAGIRYADLKIGPFFLQPRFTVRDIGWDSNVFGRADPGEVSDFRSTLAPGTRIVLPFRERHRLSGDVQLDYQWFRETTELRTFNTGVDVRYEYSSERLHFTLGNRFLDAERNQLDAIELADEPFAPRFEIIGRVGERRNESFASSSIDLTRRLLVEARAGRRVVRFDEGQLVETIDLAETLDRTEESAGGGLGYRLFPKMTVLATYDWQRNDYEIPGNIREADTWRAALGVELDESAPLSGRISAGYRELRPEQPDVEGFEGLVGAGSLVLHLRDLVEISLAGERDVFPSLWFENVYALREGGGAGGLVQVTRDLAVGTEVNYYEHRYPLEATVSAPDGTEITARRLDRTIRYAGRVRWRIGRINNVELRLGYYDRASSFETQEASGIFLGSGYSLIY